MRPPPRTPPFDDFNAVASKLAEEFNNDVSILPEQAKQMWTEPELQTFFASGGLLCPPDNPKLRAAAEKQAKEANVKSASQIAEEARLQEMQKAAMNLPWVSKLTDLDREKAGMYREAAFARGIPHRPHGLFPADDALIKEFSQARHIHPFEKHLLFWDAPKCPAKGGASARHALSSPLLAQLVSRRHALNRSDVHHLCNRQDSRRAARRRGLRVRRLGLPRSRSRLSVLLRREHA